MKKKPQIKKDEVAELKSLLLRTQADFDNYRKRTQKEKEEFATFLNTDLILRLIPVLDNFKLALKHMPQELENNNWAAGIFHIERQLEQILEDEGVQQVLASGQFDPNLHEAIEEVESEKPPGEIAEVVLAGYKLKDKVIRHAKVKVSRGETRDKGSAISDHKSNKN